MTSQIVSIPSPITSSIQANCRSVVTYRSEMTENDIEKNCYDMQDNVYAGILFLFIERI